MSIEVRVFGEGKDDSMIERREFLRQTAVLAGVMGAGVSHGCRCRGVAQGNSSEIVWTTVALD
jgi:hypothetical protein